MKRLVLMAAASIFMLSSVPAFSASQAEKDECLLASRNCVNQVDDIYKRMHKLDKEIKKGTKVYTPAELKKLKEKLDETDNFLKDMMERGGN